MVLRGLASRVPDETAPGARLPVGSGG